LSNYYGAIGAAERSLAGLKVIDLSEWVAGPYCTKLFAELGAEVIKVERPGTGDPTRLAGPFPGEIPDPERSGLFLYLNTSKKSVTLDLESESDRTILACLIAEADVLMDTFVPGTLASLGLDDERLRELNPGLIVTSITNFGQTGPYKGYVADEITLLAMGGLLYMTGRPADAPLKMGGMLAQYCAGINGFIGSMAALVARRQIGLGQHVDIAITETVMEMLEGAIAQWSYDQQVRVRTGNAASGGWGIYPCKDGYVAVVSGARDTFRRFAELFDEPELADPKYDSPRGRQQYRDEIEALMLPWLLEHTRQEVYERAQALHLPFGYFSEPRDLLTSRHLQVREFFVEIDHPRAGRLPYPGAPFRLSRTPMQFSRAPLLGEHNGELLARQRSKPGTMTAANVRS